MRASVLGQIKIGIYNKLELFHFVSNQECLQWFLVKEGLQGYQLYQYQDTLQL